MWVKEVCMSLIQEQKVYLERELYQEPDKVLEKLKTNTMFLMRGAVDGFNKRDAEIFLHVSNYLKPRFSKSGNTLTINYKELKCIVTGMRRSEKRAYWEYEGHREKVTAQDEEKVIVEFARNVKFLNDCIRFLNRTY
jgi:hypothetical protein